MPSTLSSNFSSSRSSPSLYSVLGKRSPEQMPMLSLELSARSVEDMVDQSTRNIPPYALSLGLLSPILWAAEGPFDFGGQLMSRFERFKLRPADLQRKLNGWTTRGIRPESLTKLDEGEKYIGEIGEAKRSQST